MPEALEPRGDECALAWAFVPFCQRRLAWWQVVRVLAECAFWIGLGAVCTGWRP